VATDVQHARRVADATGIHGHIDNLLLHVKGLPCVSVVQQKGVTCTGLLSAAVPLLALPGLAMADNIGALTVGTMQGLEDHEVTQLYWGC
jgi:hypothetical protein